MRRYSTEPTEPDMAVPVLEARTSVRESMFTSERELSDVVARVYTLERRMQESVLTGRPSKYVPSRSLAGRVENLEAAPRKSMWVKIAQFLAQKRIWPIDYIARQFDQACSLGRPLFPNQLIGDMAWQRYTNSKAEKQKELEVKATVA